VRDAVDATGTHISYIGSSLHVQSSRLSATIPSVVALTWLGFLGWLGALLLAIALVLGLLALIAYSAAGRMAWASRLRSIPAIHAVWTRDAAHYSRTYVGVVPVRTPFRLVEVEAGRVWLCPRPPSRKPLGKHREGFLVTFENLRPAPD
jgi:hypothetical protein